MHLSPTSKLGYLSFKNAEWSWMERIQIHMTKKRKTISSVHIILKIKEQSSYTGL